jgi:hypothetical protein
VGIDGSGCNELADRFTIREVTFGAGNQVLSLAADFVSPCLDVRGVVRYNSAIPLAPPDPVAVAGRSRLVGESATVMLDGRHSYDADGSIASYAWRQRRTLRSVSPILRRPSRSGRRPMSRRGDRTSHSSSR